jgi:cytochrome P450
MVIAAPLYGVRYLFGVRSVAMLGPEANELVLFDRDKNFSSSDGWGFLLGRLFPRGLMLMDFDEHRLHRKALGVAFKPTPMRAYLGALNNGISQGSRNGIWPAQDKAAPPISSSTLPSSS